MSQLSFDAGAGLGVNKCEFSYFRFNDNDGYHNSLIYPIYNTDPNKPYTASPLLYLGINTERSQLFNLRFGVSTGIYKENVTYNFISNEYGTGNFTRTIVKGSGFINQPFLRFEITPTIKIQKFKLLISIFNFEKLSKTLGAKIKVEQSTYNVISKNHISSFSYPGDSVVTLIGQESITLNNPLLNKGIEGHRTIFFPISLGLEYECVLNKSTFVFGSKILVSYSTSYAATPHNSFMLYVSYRFRKKQIN